MGIKEERNLRTEWMMQDRFGMFLHWGLYAIPARGEWVRNQERISNEAYEKYFKTFNPTDYDPKKWAALAKKAGMKYAVLTTKHHDGFCLFDSALTDYKATNTPAKRDLVREYVDAFRAEGIKIGFYYSLLDWHHPDYPAYGDRIHPMRENEAYKNQNGEQFERYVDYFHGQVKELLTNYGKIDILWFDFSYDTMTGEKWQATKLINMVRNLQPDIIIDNRLGGDIRSENPELYSGDFASPEQTIPAEGMTDSIGDPLPWEACITLNYNWGYTVADHDYKTPKDVVHALVECVSKKGNLLLNVGPDAKGNIPKESIDILSKVGDWMELNAKSIYGCTASGYSKPEWGRLTQNGNKLYAHIFERSMVTLALNNIAETVTDARLVRDDSEVKISVPWYATHYGEGKNVYITLNGHALPDELDTVVELTLEDET
jgi:Alpha-L-fucosidase